MNPSLFPTVEERLVNKRTLVSDWYSDPTDVKIQAIKLQLEHGGSVHPCSAHGN